MSGFKIHPINYEDRKWVAQFIAERWGAEIIVAHSVVYRPQDLPGFIAIQDQIKIGLVTYSIIDKSCEIVSLDSIRPSIGIGTVLVEAVKEEAIKSGCKRLWLTTTNDNLNALRFYQKRGFRLVKIHKSAVETARKYKSIPLIGADGIRIMDEIELEMLLDGSK